MLSKTRVQDRWVRPAASAGSQRPGELLAKRLPRPVEPGFHRRDRLAEQLRGLLVGELLDVPERHDRPVALGQGVERPLQYPARLAREELALGILRPVGEEIGAVALPVTVRLEGRQVLLERGLELAALAPSFVQRRVRGDPVDPAPEGRALLE